MSLRERQNPQIYQGVTEEHKYATYPRISCVSYFFCAALCRATSLVGIYYPALWIICMCLVIPHVSCNPLSHWSPSSWRDRTQRPEDVGLFALSAHTTRRARAIARNLYSSSCRGLCTEGSGLSSLEISSRTHLSHSSRRFDSGRIKWNGLDCLFRRSTRKRINDRKYIKKKKLHLHVSWICLSKTCDYNKICNTHIQ